jgi:hypothetical protein
MHDGPVKDPVGATSLQASDSVKVDFPPDLAVPGSRREGLFRGKTARSTREPIYDRLIGKPSFGRFQIVARLYA